MTNQHSGLIAETASAALSPLGLVRKGQSRIWLDDQSWWLGVAEFKPSNWKPGAYLNVGLMFLWHPADHYIFEIGGQVEGFSPADGTNFVQAVHAKAERAALEIGTLRAIFRSADDVIRHYAPSSGRTSIYGHANLATALGLVGNMEHCRRALDRALRKRETATVNLKDASAWLLKAREAAEDTASFRSWVMAATQQTRQNLRLPDEFALPAGPSGYRTLSSAAAPGEDPGTADAPDSHAEPPSGCRVPAPRSHPWWIPERRPPAELRCWK